MNTPTIEGLARDLAGDEETRQSIVDGLRMRLHLFGPEDNRPRYEATLRALQALAQMRELVARSTPARVPRG
jgi:hypothetical protein